MILFFECLIGIIAFSLIVVPMGLKDPLGITWFDALVLDCIWFCHSKRMRIPGTEDMKEYQDYLFHIKQSCIGTLIGIPACAVVGLFVALLADVI